MADESGCGPILEPLARAVSAFGGLLDAAAVGRALLDQALAVGGVAAGSVALLAGDGERLETVAGVGLSSPAGPQAVSASRVDASAVAGELVEVPDLAAEPGLFCRDEAARAGCRAALVMPLRIRERTLGLLRLYAVEPDSLRGDRLRTVRLLGDLGALAIEKARLHESIFRLAEAVGSDLALEPMARAVLETVAEEMGFKAAMLRLLAKDGQTLKLVAATGLSERYLAKGDVRRDRSPVDQRALAGEAIVLRDEELAAEWQYPEELAAEGVVAVMVVPVTVAEQRRGVLRAYSSRPRQHGPVAQSYLAAVARLLGLAIEKAELYEALRARYEDLRLDLADWRRFLALG